ncbi:hypothetical protein AURDEDRAFT_163271 [Auricularia subglabra TFB-10046 SS5]|nr:hypothetical protein AURDEDRAFT_163271 [Auricularia subglabra TFB-10046 SS5]
MRNKALTGIPTTLGEWRDRAIELESRNKKLEERVEAYTQEISALEKSLYRDGRYRDASLACADGRAAEVDNREAGTEPRAGGGVGIGRLACQGSEGESGESGPLRKAIRDLIELTVHQQAEITLMAMGTLTPERYRDANDLREELVSRRRELLLRKYLPAGVSSSEMGSRRGEENGALRNVVEARMADDAAYFDPDAATYDQYAFVSRSMQGLSNGREGHHGRVPEPNFKTSAHFIWTDEEYNTPIPLGKYGQPYFPNSSWADFNPERLWKDVSPGRVARGEELWVRLAMDAARLPFEFRSHAQRILVSEAHRVKAAGSERNVLPMVGDVPEMDVWHLCTNNALYMPLAVRRQYTYDRERQTLYREWDAGDIGVYLIMRACGPEGEKKRGKEKRKKDGDGQRTATANWTELFRQTVLWGAEQHLRQG